METHSLISDLNSLELGRDHFPRFGKDASEEEVKNILADLKEVVRKQRDILTTKYRAEPDGGAAKIKEIEAAAERIFNL